MTEPFQDHAEERGWRWIPGFAYRHRHTLVFGWLVLLWWTTFYRLGALRHDRYWTFGFDLGLFDQAIWLVAHFKRPFMTLRGLDVWGHHGNFIFILFAPFYWMGAGAKFLLVVQLLSQASGAVGIYLLSRDLLDRARWIGVALGTAMLLHPSMQFLTWEFFHPETFAIGPIILAYWALRTQRRKLFWVMAILAMASKEDVTLVFVMLGLLLLARKDFRLGGLIAGVAAVWYLAVTKLLIPWRNPAGPFYEEHFFSNYGGSVGGVVKTVFRHPMRLWRDLTAPGRREFYTHMWFPVAFVPFIAPEVLLLMAPMFFIIVLASIPWVQDYRYHYMAIPLAVTFIATVEAFRRLKVPWRRNTAAGVILVTSLVGSFAWGVGPYSHNWSKGYWPHSKTEGYFDILVGNLQPMSKWPKSLAKQHAVALIPADASVSASFNVNPHLAHREKIYEWPNPWIGTNWGICNFDNLDDPAQVDWFIIDRSYLKNSPIQLGLLDRLLRDEFVVRLEESGVVTAERVKPPANPRSPAPTDCS